MTVMEQMAKAVKSSVRCAPTPAAMRRASIMRAREEFCRLFLDPQVDPASAAGLNAYFLPFAVAARRRAARERWLVMRFFGEQS